MTTSTEETYEQRLARIRAQEQAEREHRASLPAIDPSSLIVTYGQPDAEAFEPLDPICGRCGAPYDPGLAFRVAIDGQPGKVCTDCLDGAGDGTYPAALARLLQSLEDIESAIGNASARMRPALLGIAGQALAWLVDFYGAALSLEQLRALSAAMQEHHVTSIGGLPDDVLGAILDGPTTLTQPAARSGCSRCGTAPGYCDSLAPATCCPGCNHEPQP